MYETTGPIANLVHLYVDGAFSRRELIRRLTVHVGTAAAAVAVLDEFGVSEAFAQSSCPADVHVPVDAPDLISQNVSYPGDAGTLLGYLSRPKQLSSNVVPAIIVIHENRGLVDHIKDVTRRAARAGFVALGVDLLSRQGGTDQFKDPVDQQAAYGRTTQGERRSDLFASVDYLKHLPFVKFDRIGVVGFCAGGGNVWDLAVYLEELAAAVSFYGAPPTDQQMDQIKAPVLGIYAELDRALTTRMAPTLTAMLMKQKTFGLNVYEGVGHAFHNDTGPAYNPAAACDAWARTLAWFQKFLFRA